MYRELLFYFTHLLYIKGTIPYSEFIDNTTTYFIRLLIKNSI